MATGLSERSAKELREARAHGMRRWRSALGAAPWRMAIQYPFRLSCGHVGLTEREGVLQGAAAWCPRCVGVKQVVATGVRVGMRYG